MQLLEYIRNKWRAYKTGKSVLIDNEYSTTKILTVIETKKRPGRAEIINYFLGLTDRLNYLEIEINNPEKNFVKIICKNKYSVDPGFEFPANPADYKITSDVFFEKLNKGELPELNNVRFDVIFIDGLHISHQVERDLFNSIDFLKEKGFIILHDCNPPSEHHQRENSNYFNSPAGEIWNGTTWKAFYKFRHNKDFFSVCFDTDWGVAVISKTQLIGFNQIQGKLENTFFEFQILHQNREKHLNLKNFDSWEKELVL